MPTAAIPPPSPSSFPIGRLDSTPGAAAFAPGQILNERYRIIGRLGRGGMGEVFRADDLKLGQPVSLKFLPRALAATPGLLERFHAEVRNARHVSHPNVCRVYDIGEIDGQHFLTMEFVDGEDLATLLRRIGRLPAAKANEVARQLCAGVAAAHDKGVLHRDLKPSNVMLDGEGRVRITDFGLAIRPSEAAAGDFAGTPAYMSPEQFDGKPVSERSDLYSLGLVLYELYTGRRPFDALSIAEWKNRHTHSQPAPPSTQGDPLDEATERAILRCLEKDPAKRPASALQLAAALPGGDPVAAALAAGETPSPEMVAASGGDGALSPRSAWMLLGLFAASIVAILALAPHATDLGLAPLRRGPEVLRARAREILAQLGLDRGAVDSADWFDRDYEPMQYLAQHMPSTKWRPIVAARGAPVVFHYRQSPEWMEMQDWRGRVSEIQPPDVLPGMVTLALDGDGALRSLTYHPPRYDSTATSGASSVDWAPLFHAARLDIASFHPVPPRWQLGRPFDTRAEWVGPAPWATSMELRITAGSYHGTPTYFAVLGPWSRPQSQLRPDWNANVWVIQSIFMGFVIALLIAGGWVAWRNVRLGRGDRRGASRLAQVMAVMAFATWLASTHYFPEFVPFTWNLLNVGVAYSVTTAAFAAYVYLALEPYVRRRMPELLIGWARLLEGRWRDARVARELLIGTACGASLALLVHVAAGLPAWIPVTGETPIPPSADVLAGGRGLVAALLSAQGGGVFNGILLLGVLFLLRVLLRNHAAALIGTTLFVIATTLGGENILFEAPAAVAAGIVIVACLMRSGLLGAAVMFAVNNTLLALPLPIGSGAPYTATSIIVLVLLIMTTLAAFRAALGGRLALGRRFAEELG